MSSKPDSQEVGEKRKLSTESSTGSIKKIVLNRNPIIKGIKVDYPKGEDISAKTCDDAKPGKKVIRGRSEGKNRDASQKVWCWYMVPIYCCPCYMESAKKKPYQQGTTPIMETIHRRNLQWTPVHVTYKVLKKCTIQTCWNVSLDNYGGS